MEIFFKGKLLHLENGTVAEKDKAADFTAVKQDMSEVKLSDYDKKIIVLTSFPSLDTPVCDLQLKRFNMEASGLSPDIQVIGISMDLPFAQKRFCEANKIENVEVISDYKYRSFALNYGLMVRELGLLARAVLIIRGGVVRFADINREISAQPDYEKALRALSDILGSEDA